MKLELSLMLPRDSITVPIARAICTHAMSTLGVADGCVHDVEVAVTEACTNVLSHAAEGDEYEVMVRVEGTMCVIEVLDTGRGFDHASLGADAVAPPTAERGRGIQIMRALMDRIEFTSRPAEGTVCHLEKDLEWEASSPLRERAEQH